MEHLARPSIAEEEVSELGPNELNISELAISLVPGEHSSHELARDLDDELTPSEHSQRDEVAVTEPLPRPSEFILKKIVLQT